MKVTKYVVRKCLRETLMTLKPGDTFEINYKDFRPHVVRTAARRLNASKSGKYSVTEAGVSDGCLVTRIE